MRCAYVNGDDYIKGFSKKGKFSASFSDYGYFIIKLDGNAAKLGKVQNVVESRVITGRGESFSHDVIVLNYEGLVVEASKKKSNGEDTDIKGLQDYLFPENSLGIKSDFNRVISQIVEKTSLTSNDIEEIRTIANCGGQYFSTKNRYLIISKILSYSGSESYEDLILDLIENHGDDDNFATEFLGYLNEDISLLKALFREMDNSTLVWGKEENFDRFLQVIFKLWLNSSYKEESKYDYYNYAFSGATKPRCFNYDGSYWFPETSYTTSFTDVNVQFNYEYSSSGVQKSGKIEYDFFQPIYIVNNVEGGLLTTKKAIPAIYLAGIIKNNNLDHSIKTLSIITDVALTFTAVGNLSKLRHLTKLKRGVKIFIGGIEFASSGLDIILNYTDICSDDEFCNSLKEYNSYLQLALVGGELIKASLKTTLKETKDKVAKEYAEKRNKLQDKFSDDEIKELDEHFGYDRISSSSGTPTTRFDDFFNRFDEDLSELRKVVNKLSEADQIKFLDDFENLKNRNVIEQLKDPNGALFLGWKKFRNKYENIGICID